MNLTVSNIAWGAEQEKQSFKILQKLNINKLEIAPTVIWPAWSGASATAALEYSRHLDAEGFSVSSMQAIFFAKPETTLFSGSEVNNGFFSHLRFVAQLAQALSAKKVVLGAPKNRLRGSIPHAQAVAKVSHQFKSIGDIFLDAGAVLCLEPNPPEYGCDFINTVAEAAELIDAANSQGFQLHLDTACSALVGEEPELATASHISKLAHVHISEPNLGNFDNPQIDHARFADALAKSNYGGFLSIEMRRTELSSLERACLFVQNAYGKVLNAEIES